METLLTLVGLATIGLSIYGLVVIAKSALASEKLAGKIWKWLAFIGLIFFGFAYFGVYTELEESESEYAYMVSKATEIINECQDEVNLYHAYYGS
jgi:hypothetical protein